MYLFADENRGHLLDAEFPQSVVALLASYEKAIPADRKTGLLPMTVPHLKVVKTAIGVLLNACIGYGLSSLGTSSLQSTTHYPFDRGCEVSLDRLTSSCYDPSASDCDIPRWILDHRST